MLPRHRWNWISRLFFSLLLCRQAWKCHFLLLLRAFSRSSFNKKKDCLDCLMNWVRKMIWVDGITFKNIIIEILKGFRYYWSLKLFFRFSNYSFQSQKPTFLHHLIHLRNLSFSNTYSIFIPKFFISSFTSRFSTPNKISS